MMALCLYVLVHVISTSPTQPVTVNVWVCVQYMCLCVSLCSDFQNPPPLALYEEIAHVLIL